MVLWYPPCQILLWAELVIDLSQSRSIVTVETEYLGNRNMIGILRNLFKGGVEGNIYRCVDGLKPSRTDVRDGLQTGA